MRVGVGTRAYGRAHLSGLTSGLTSIAGVLGMSNVLA